MHPARSSALTLSLPPPLPLTLSLPLPGSKQRACARDGAWLGLWRGVEAKHRPHSFALTLFPIPTPYPYPYPYP